MGFDASVLRGGLAAWREASGWTPAARIAPQDKTQSPAVRG
jgi:hypothetical protein